MMLSKLKEEIVARAKVPSWMANDPFESVTQEEYVTALRKQAEALALSAEELQNVVEDRLPRGEHWSLIKGA